jgi:ABC-type glutathione transport system ATPase component
VFDGKKIFEMKKKELISARKDMQIIFQDPFSSLNPSGPSSDDRRAAQVPRHHPERDQAGYCETRCWS